MRIPLLSRDNEVRAWTEVDADDFFWLSAWTWRLSSHGYAMRNERRGGRAAPMCTLPMHRVILGLEHGDPREADHVDRDTLNNRRANLRIVERGENVQNRRSFAGSSSRHRGVSWEPRLARWKAQAQVNGQKHYLGLFEDEQEAAAVIRAFRLERMPLARD